MNIASVRALKMIAAGVAALADALESDEASGAPRFYTRTSLPPGCPSWRSARATAARLGVATSKPGRELLIDAADFDGKVGVGAKAPAVSKISTADAQALRELGLVVPLRRAGGAR